MSTTLEKSTQQICLQTWIDEPEPARAVARLRKELDGRTPTAVILYPTPGYDLSRLAEALRGVFDVPVLSCSSAGVLCSSQGYVQGDGIVACAILTDRIDVRFQVIENLRDFGFDEAQRLSESLQLSAEQTSGGPMRFGMLLVDAMTFCEDRLTALMYGATRLPIVGGSAGNLPDRTSTYVFDGHDFRENIASLAVITTDLPCRLMRHQHFHAGEERVVVTEADPDNRRIISLDAEPAAQLYRRLIGTEDLSAAAVAKRPILLQCNGESFARSIRCTNDDDSLSIYAAIEQGMVVRIGQADDMISFLSEELRRIDEALGGVAMIHAFDCILRRSECENDGNMEPFRRAIERYGMLGFNTFGEQCDGMNINQTLTGFAIGHG